MMSGIQHFIQTVQRMQLSDYLDILVVAFLIYSLLPHLKNPNIMKIVRTVGTLVLIAWLTGEMQLYTISWLLSQLLSIGLLAFVVLFQPELRHMLNHLGDLKVGQLFGFEKPVQEMEMIIQQTCMACEIMSREKVGALIVFSRKNRMDEYFKTGTVINGRVTEQLLRNIFVNKAPLHDGAVIVQDGKIAAAGCVLPVSNSTALSKDLGTRHRASLGISEVSDAVAVVVSEEKGTISVFVGGVPKRPLTPATLEKLLRNELCPQDENQISRRERFTEWLAGLRKEGNEK
ncbi:MAG: diadenylate cyclase CdaA [Oscillospiraceae bacterium]|nr:diadenylate cyclase CdaA [Oscillospiraceae bacterium]